MTGTSGDPLSRLAVLVVNYGSHAVVEQNLTRSLHEGFPGQVVIVDNFSSAGEREAARSMCARHGWVLLPLAVNVGFGEGSNRAAQHAIRQGARELLLLNPDAWISYETVRELHARVQKNPMVQLSPEIVRPDGTLYTAEVDLYLARGEMQAARHRDAGSHHRIHTWVSGACFMISSSLWERVGGFDDDYFLYWEDVDLSRRVVVEGGTVQAVSSLRAVHDEGTTHRKDHAGRVKSPIYYYYNTRNRLIYAAKHLSPKDSRRWLFTTPYASYRILLQGGRRQFARPHLNVWPAFRGSLAGMRMWWRLTRRAKHAKGVQA